MWKWDGVLVVKFTVGFSPRRPPTEAFIVNVGDVDVATVVINIYFGVFLWYGDTSPGILEIDYYNSLARERCHLA